MPVTAWFVRLHCACTTCADSRLMCFFPRVVFLDVQTGFRQFIQFHFSRSSIMLERHLRQHDGDAFGPALENCHGTIRQRLDIGALDVNGTPFKDTGMDYGHGCAPSVSASMFFLSPPPRRHPLRIRPQPAFPRLGLRLHSFPVAAIPAIPRPDPRQPGLKQHLLQDAHTGNLHNSRNTAISVSPLQAGSNINRFVQSGTDHNCFYGLAVRLIKFRRVFPCKRTVSRALPRARAGSMVMMSPSDTSTTRAE